MSVKILNPAQILGSLAIRFVQEMGGMFMFGLQAFALIFHSPGQAAKIVRQIFFIGVKSLFVIVLVGLFTGMVLGFQGYYTLVKFGSEGLLGSAVSLSLIRELGPVLTAIMIIGRAGSSMTAEIGVMRITDQIDALEVMDISPIAFLVSPRLAASIIVFPLLTAIFDIVGIIGGYLTGVKLLGINSGLYFYRISSSVTMEDVAGGFYKAVLFALLVAIICCYQGYFTHRRRDATGPEGVGNATTSAVVLSCVMVLCGDYVLTSFMV